MPRIRATSLPPPPPSHTYTDVGIEHLDQRRVADWKAATSWVTEDRSFRFDRWCERTHRVLIRSLGAPPGTPLRE